MRKIEAQTIQAIRALLWEPSFSGCFWQAGNMSVSQTHQGIHGTIGYGRIISVRLHGNEICAIRPDCESMWLSDCGWQTVTTKARLNLLLGCFAPGYGVFQHKGEWFVSGFGGGDRLWREPDKTQGSLTFPFKLNADNWRLDQAYKIAGPKLARARA